MPIYQYYDYIDKYAETLTYIFQRAIHNRYSFDYIQKRICFSEMVIEFEKSNVTLIAFNSYKKNYSLMFDDSDSFEYQRNNLINWISHAYIYLFINKQITFESLFLLFPIEEMINLFPLYHEMSVSKLDELYSETTKYSLLDAIMTKRNMSSNKLAALSGISISTIKFLRYNKRDLNKLQYSYVREIAKQLDVRIESLFNLRLELD